MKFRISILFFTLLCCFKCFATNDSLMNSLLSNMKQAKLYDAEKIKIIKSLETEVSKTGTKNYKSLLSTYDRIYEEYKIFNYDSAYRYATRLLNVSEQLNDSLHITDAKLKISFILLSSGLYKETFDSLTSLSKTIIPVSKRADYYTLWARYYYDIAAYNNDNYHSVDYDKKGSLFLDTALSYYPPASFELIYYSGLRYFKQGKTDSAFYFFEKIISDPVLTFHQYALTASTLSGIYQQKGNIDKAIDLLIKATIADIKSSTKETVAIFNLAGLLYKKGDLKNASLCIENAIANAEFYGARQRKIQTSSILPLIDGERINSIEAQKALLIKYSIVVTALLILLAMLAYIIFKQVRKLKIAKQQISGAHTLQQKVNAQLEETNKRLEETNHRLEDVNGKLEEANKFKEEYIGYFFNTDSLFYSKLDEIKKTLEQKLVNRRYDEIKFFLNKIDGKKEKEELLLTFDKIFLKLFPNFVSSINELLYQEYAIQLKEGELLNTDLRIFALIRMGISDTEKIAQILEYSVKTIYSYKTKMKNKSIVPNDKFEEKVMEIKSL
jgi:cell division protein FtsB